MEKIDVHSRTEYLRVIKESYFKAVTRKERWLKIEDAWLSYY